MQSLRIFSRIVQGALVSALLVWTVPAASAADLPITPKAENLMSQTRTKLQRELQARGFQAGQPIFVRIFKIPGTLEVWMNKGRGFELFKAYRICTFSGFPGPKVNEGDWQAPEGFYSVTPEQLNPKSGYHLAFDVGYPNEFDIAKHHTGSLIMVHGDCQSVGCFAMTNHRIEEIYFLAHEALARGQEQFSVHIFPFPLTPRNLQKFAASPWISFWKSLEPGFAAFEQFKQVPEIAVRNGEYVVTSRGPKLAMKRGGY
nr:2-dehydro-3-deoxyphosphooctonate aldolase [uncultured Desulfobulbus sp.]